jgi:hypothetical protein
MLLWAGLPTFYATCLYPIFKTWKKNGAKLLFGHFDSPAQCGVKNFLNFQVARVINLLKVLRMAPCSATFRLLSHMNSGLNRAVREWAALLRRIPSSF